MEKYMHVNGMENEILHLIALKQEGGYWDFKREWYHDLTDLLHDIICMANNLENKDAYIIIGIDEANDFRVIDITNDPNRKSTHLIVDFLRNKKFAGGIRPTVYVQPIVIYSNTIDVLVVKNDYNTPYYLTENYKGVFSNNIYTRIMDSNTPKTSSADRPHIEYLWKKHFRIEMGPAERVLYYLTMRNDWINAHTETSSIEYYKFFPEYTIEHVSAAEDRDGYEYYLFNQTDNRPHWYDIEIRFHQTIIASLRGIALDGGRYFTSTPRTDGFSFDRNSMDWDICYKYFIKGTIEYAVHCFYYVDDGDEARHAHNCFLEYILVFETEQEKEKFEKFVLQHKDQLSELAQKVHLPHFPELEGYRMSAFKKQYADVCALKKMLDVFREVI